MGSNNVVLVNSNVVRFKVYDPNIESKTSWGLRSWDPFLYDIEKYRDVTEVIITFGLSNILLIPKQKKELKQLLFYLKLIQLSKLPKAEIGNTEQRR